MLRVPVDRWGRRRDGDLAEEFRRIAGEHRMALRARFARANLGASVIRVFASGTKPGLLRVLRELPVDDLRRLERSGFRAWYRRQLEKVARELRKRNRDNVRLQPGLKWGHAAKVLSLYLRDIVLHSRYFPDATARRVERWLYVPVDGIVIRRLKELGVELPFGSIREIDTAAKFELVQGRLDRAARSARVPRVWFDDIWADREQ